MLFPGHYLYIFILFIVQYFINFNIINQAFFLSGLFWSGPLFDQ